jgi:hypothetical protein
MSSKYPGGVISKTAPTPSGPYADSTAPGVWTLEQQAYWQKLGQWPTAGNVNPNAFIENLFSTYLYTGNGSTQTITNGIDLSTNGGLVWGKVRSTTGTHELTDTVRGANNALNSNNTDAQSNSDVTAFTSSGYTLGYVSGNENFNGRTYASWTFREQAKFFDVVTYTGNGTAGRTVAHDLGSVPGCIIVKQTSASGQDWMVYHRSLATNDYILLNSTGAASTYPYISSPTSTTFTVESAAPVNSNGATYVAYLFAHDAGGFGLTGSENVISCGSFNYNTDPQTVTLGYEPQWLMVKQTDGVGDWIMFDNMRGFTANSGGGAGRRLLANTSGAETANDGLYYGGATGFSLNLPAYGNYIYIAIRKGPMAVPTLGTSVFKPILTGSGATLSDSYSAIGFPIDMTLRYQTGTDTDGAFKNAVYTRLMGINSGATDTPTSANNPNLLTHSSAAEITTYYYSQTGSMGLDYGGSWNSPAYVLTHLHFKRAPSFFDVVCYTGTGAVRTISHNLGVAPELMISKTRGVSNPWQVWTKYFSYLSGTAASDNCTGVLNSTNAFDGYSESSSINALPTASVFSLGTQSVWNGSTKTAVMYLFATCPGVSKVGSYTGTGAAQTINCGFTGGSRFVMIKRADSTGDWYVWDSARGIIPSNDPYLLLNSTAAEVTGTDYVDTTSVGFDITSTAPAAINANGGTFIFLAIA